MFLVLLCSSDRSFRVCCILFIADLSSPFFFRARWQKNRKSNMPHQWRISAWGIWSDVISKSCRLSGAPKCEVVVVILMYFYKYYKYIRDTIKKEICKKGVSRQNGTAMMVHLGSAFAVSKMCLRIWIKHLSAGEISNLVITSPVNDYKASPYNPSQSLIAITLLMEGAVLSQGWIGAVLFGFQPCDFAGSLWD